MNEIMDAIIESLKARRARNAAMLNPGVKTGSGSAGLIKSSSLQPQTVFRQMKASLSVNRPSVTVMRTSSFSSFSKSAGENTTKARNCFICGPHHRPPHHLRYPPQCKGNRLPCRCPPPECLPLRSLARLLHPRHPHPQEQCLLIPRKASGGRWCSTKRTVPAISKNG